MDYLLLPKGAFILIWTELIQIANGPNEPTEQQLGHLDGWFSKFASSTRT